MELKLNLDEIFVDGCYSTTVGEIFRDVLKEEIRKSVKTAIKSDPNLRKAMKKLQDHAAKQIIDSL